MPRPRQLPDTATLRRWVEEGLTHDEITVRVYEETGQKVARSTVSVALHRAGLTAVGHRYASEIPWQVPTRFAAQYPVRMLRLLGRVRAGDTDIPDAEMRRFDKWRQWVEDENVAVAFNDEIGFFYVRADQPGDWPDGIPIRPGITPSPSLG